MRQAVGDHDKNRATRIPHTAVKNADIKTGGGCNNRCAHCVLPTWGEDESAEAYMGAISAAVQTGHNGITITGGEPTIHPAILDIVAHAKSLGVHVTLQTNGRRLCDEGFAAEIARHVDTFAIALHGPNPAVHDAITGRPGSFEQTVAGVRHIAAAGKLIAAKLVLTSLNAGHILATTRLMVDLGFDIFVFSYVHGVGNARRNYDRLAVRYTDLWPQVKASVDHLTPRYLPANLETFPFCIVRGYEALVAEINFLAGEFNVKFVGHELQSWTSARLKQKTKFEACSKCSFDPLCEGVWTEYADKFGSAEICPRDDHQFFARFRDRLERSLAAGRRAGQHTPSGTGPRD
jgi:MoaA/NifB/PqqE/SkfB family radical SAM enzyme